MLLGRGFHRVIYCSAWWSKNLAHLTHAQILGLRGRVTLTDIKRHYRERMLEYHPDRVAALGPKLREVAELETKKINAAYEFFTAKYSSRNF